MGYGDTLMAIGAASRRRERDLKKRRVAVGDGARVDVSVFQIAPNMGHLLASQADVDAGEDVSWVISYPGQRPYIDYPAIRAALTAQGHRVLKPKKLVGRLGRYIFDPSYRPDPAPLALTEMEETVYRKWAARPPFVLMEPYIKAIAPPGKQWAPERFAEVARQLRADGYDVFQCSAPDAPNLPGPIERIQTPTFRALAPIMKAAALYIGVEGGLHHLAAAFGTRAVVVFGAFVGAEVTGYPFHVNLTGGYRGPGTGTRNTLDPICAEAMNNITAEQVLAHARRLLKES